MLGLQRIFTSEGGNQFGKLIMRHNYERALNETKVPHSAMAGEGWWWNIFDNRLKLYFVTYFSPNIGLKSLSTTHVMNQEPGQLKYQKTVDILKCICKMHHQNVWCFSSLIPAIKNVKKWNPTKRPVSTSRSISTSSLQTLFLLKL